MRSYPTAEELRDFFLAHSTRRSTLDDEPVKPMHEFQVCRSCGFHHEKVEAGGVYHCPNLLCSSSGAAIHRMKVPSYTPEGSTHSIDELEWIGWAIQQLRDGGPITDRVLRRKITETAIERLTGALGSGDI